MSSSRPARRLLGVTGAAVGVTWALALPAAAHVTVHADSSMVGATDVAVSFRVPNEQQTAPVTQLAVRLPTDHPLLGVLVRPHQGWTSTVTQVQLNPPVKTDDGTVTQAVSQVTWTASTAAVGIPVGGYDDFTIDAGKLPDGQSTLTFKAIQTYSNGVQVGWIEQSPPGQPAPDHPAPALTLTPAGVGSSATAPAAAPAAPVPVATAAASTADTTARALGIAGIVLAALFGIGGYRLGRRAASRPVPAASAADRAGTAVD